MKMTKVESFIALKELATGAEKEDLVAFCDEQIRQIEEKSRKAAEYKAKKKAESDTLTEKVLTVLTDECQTRQQILDNINAQYGEDEDLTVGKITSKLTALIKDEKVVKERQTIDKKALTCYRLA